MDNRALLRAAGFISDAFTALNLQRSKLKDEPTTPEDYIDDLERIIDSLTEISAELTKLTDKEV